MYRALFSKRGNAIWISHLDLMRVLQRSFRRAGLLLKHSQGFTPHPALSLALPLSVGVASDCELMDFELIEPQETDGLPARLNAVLPAGIEILTVYEPTRKIKELTHLRVAITMEYDRGIPTGCAEAISALLAKDEILMEKRTKSGAMVKQNIMEMLRDCAIEAVDACTLRLECTICAQNPALNPSLISGAIARDLPNQAPDFSSIRRLAMLDAAGKEFR